MVIERTTGRILGVQIDALSWTTTLSRLLAWGHARESRYVAISNVHAVVTAYGDTNFRKIINEADMATPDGAPLAWMLRRLGYPKQSFIKGPDLMWALCECCAAERLPVYFYGSTDATLALMTKNFCANFPSLIIAGIESPPFRPLSVDENTRVVERINSIGAGIVFVSLGCPKQERWMAEHRGQINAVMIGVGAAFDFHAGTLRRAPLWMRNHGLEWLHRLYSEPRRLWKRYMVTNTLFLIYAAKQLIVGNER